MTSLKIQKSSIMVQLCSKQNNLLQIRPCLIEELLYRISLHIYMNKLETSRSSDDSNNGDIKTNPIHQHNINVHTKHT